MNNLDDLQKAWVRRCFAVAPWYNPFTEFSDHWEYFDFLVRTDA